MYGQDRPTLTKILEKVEENNQMLHRFQRARRWATAWGVLRWGVVIVSAAGLYYYLQPYIEQILVTWPQLQATWESLGSALPPLPR